MNTYMRPRFANLRGYSEATATKATTKKVIKAISTPHKKVVKNDYSLLILVAGMITIALGLRLATLFF